MYGTSIGKDFIENLNPNSLKVIEEVAETSLVSARADDKFQFEGHGYFVTDRVDRAAQKLVFNLAVELETRWEGSDAFCEQTSQL